MRNQRHDIDVDQIRRQEKLARYERRMLNYTYDHDEYERRQARRLASMREDYVERIARGMLSGRGE